MPGMPQSLISPDQSMHKMKSSYRFVVSQLPLRELVAGALVISLLAFGAGCATSAGGKAASETGYAITGNGKKWDALSIAFQGPMANAGDNNPNPFLDYRLQVKFTAPSGKKYAVPGFYDGDGQGGNSGNVWRV